MSLKTFGPAVFRLQLFRSPAPNGADQSSLTSALKHTEEHDCQLLICFLISGTSYLGSICIFFLTVASDENILTHLNIFHLSAIMGFGPGWVECSRVQGRSPAVGPAQTAVRPQAAPAVQLTHVAKNGNLKNQKRISNLAINKYASWSYTHTFKYTVARSGI